MLGIWSFVLVTSLINPDTEQISHPYIKEVNRDGAQSLSANSAQEVVDRFARLPDHIWGYARVYVHATANVSGNGHICFNTELCFSQYERLRDDAGYLKS